MKKRRAEELQPEDIEQIERVNKERQQRKEDRRGKDLLDKGLFGGITKISVAILIALGLATAYGLLVSGLHNLLHSVMLTAFLSPLSPLLYIPAVLIAERWYKEPFQTTDKNADTKTVLAGLATGAILAVVSFGLYALAAQPTFLSVESPNILTIFHFLSAAATSVGTTVLQVYVFRVIRRHSDWKKAVLTSALVVSLFSILAMPYFSLIPVLLQLLLALLFSLFYAMTESLGGTIALKLSKELLVGPVLGLSYGYHPMFDALVQVNIGEVPTIWNGGNFAIDGAVTTLGVVVVVLVLATAKLFQLMNTDK